MTASAAARQALYLTANKKCPNLELWKGVYETTIHHSFDSRSDDPHNQRHLWDCFGSVVRCGDSSRKVIRTKNRFYELAAHRRAACQPYLLFKRLLVRFLRDKNEQSED
jgi:hypothetical protein